MLEANGSIMAWGRFGSAIHVAVVETLYSQSLCSGLHAMAPALELVV